ncbi:hypothetical protein Ctob_010958, partial [Chrysochromulina tobinii]
MYSRGASSSTSSHSEEENDGRRSITLHLMDAGDIKLEIQWSSDPIHTVSVCKIVGPPFIMTMLLGKAVGWGELLMPNLPVATSPGGGRATREMLPPDHDLHLDLNLKGKAPCVGMFAYSKDDLTGEEFFLGRVSRVKNQKRTIQLGSSIKATNQMKLIFKEGGIAHGIELETLISPVSELLLPLEARRGVAPAKATLYGFLNPLSGLEGVLEEMHFGQNDPWAFLLLMGGYCYFDDAYNFLRANAFVMSNTAPIHFTYTGPHPASDAGIAGMIAQERMADMTIDALQSEGCEQFGWIRGNELFDGQHSLDLKNPSSTASYPYGCFLYRMTDRWEYFSLDPVAAAKQQRLRDRQNTDEAQAKDSGVEAPQRRRASLPGGIRDASDSALEMAGLAWGARQFDIALTQKAKHLSHIEHEEVKRLIGIGKEVANVSRLKIVLLQLSIPAAIGGASVAIPIALASLAYGNRAAFEVFSVCFYCSLLSYMTYKLIFSTGETVMSKVCFQYLRVWLSGIIFVFTLMMAITSSFEYAEVLHVRATGEYLCHAVYGIVTPLLIIHFNKKSALLLDDRWRTGQSLKVGKGARKGSSSSTVKKNKVEMYGSIATMSAEKDLTDGKGGPHASTSIQMFARRWLQYKARRGRLTAFETPIFMTTIFWMMAMAITEHYWFLPVSDQVIPMNPWLYWSSWLVYLLPSIAVLLYDSRPETHPPQYSINYALFFVSVLYRVCARVASFDVFSFARIVNAMGPGSTIAPAFGSLVHIITVNLLMYFGTTCLKFVAPPNTMPIFLFPFMVLQYVLNNAIFNLNNMRVAVDPSWVLIQCVTQINTIMTVSGSTSALLQRGTDWVLSKIGLKQRMLGSDPANDPIFKLQFIARLSVQFDIAIYCSGIVVPSIVSFFVWRDGYYTLEELENVVLITPCELPTMWIRFAIMWALQVGALSLTRALLARQMRRALLGKACMHGNSSLAAEIQAARAIRKDMNAQELIDERLESSDVWKAAMGSSCSAADRH